MNSTALSNEKSAPPALGRWYAADCVPRGKLTWHGAPMKVYGAHVKRDMVAVLKLEGIGKQSAWVAQIPGWVWTVTEEMDDSRFRPKEADTRCFLKLEDAKRAVEKAFQALPSKATPNKAAGE
ncbi:hypothetical protein F6X40_23875 [Paraburkholderia sp. UCT31]|uniref:hypothetical protein n=1 Tax=Paraburkholderia sp. UCT31 TaxID=2615209 RepID=UPI001655C012|nr:hypothetical protein [Paraburkholderia sp. UCT31]MBC8739755.1 hypothetical protein [Paraburkholderia sp. UCT31]